MRLNVLRSGHRVVVESVFGAGYVAAPRKVQS
jgi:hypothetical protein